jgi:hypothetical protein
MTKCAEDKEADDVAHETALRLKRVETAKAIARNICAAINYQQQNYALPKTGRRVDDAAHEMLRGACFAAEAMGNFALQQHLGQWLLLGTGVTGVKFLRDIVEK